MTDVNIKQAEPPEQKHSFDRPSPRRSRSVAIALSLIFLVLIFYIVTLAKLDTNILNNKPINVNTQK